MTRQLEFTWDLDISTVVSLDQPLDQDSVDPATTKVGKSPPPSDVLEATAVEPGVPEPETSPSETSPSDADSSAPDVSSQRVQQLELALQQCQIYIDELKSQLMHQAFLEAQLAATEEFSHIQKQAIETLKQQLAERAEQQTDYTTLQAQKTELECQLTAVQAAQQQQQDEIESLRQSVLAQQTQLQQRQESLDRLSSQVEIAQQSAVQETQQRILAQKTVERLRSQLRDREATIQKLELKLKHAEGTVASQEEVIAALKQNQSDSQKNKVIQGLSASLLKAQSKIAILETELSNHALLQVQFHHSTQELESQAKQNQERVEQLEQQVADMQEQILHQAQEASEYETAVQHWKDRCLRTEGTMGEMRQLLEQVLGEQQRMNPQGASEWTDAIADLLQSTEPPSPLPDIDFPRRNLKLDLPGIVHRWRNVKL